MKTNRLLSVLFLLLISVTTIARDNISRDEALNIIKEKLSLEQNTSVEIFVCDSIVKQSSPIALLSKEIYCCPLKLKGSSPPYPQCRQTGIADSFFEK